MVNVNREAASKTGQITDLSGPPTIKSNIFEDVLANAEVPFTLQRQVQFADIAISTPIVSERPTNYHMEQIQ